MHQRISETVPSGHGHLRRILHEDMKAEQWKNFCHLEFCSGQLERYILFTILALVLLGPYQC